MPSSRFHSLRTSQGTKRGIAPYWRRYRRGKKVGLECPFHDLCLSLAWSEKRTLYYGGCAMCKAQEGFPRAYLLCDRRYSFRVKTWEQLVKEKIHVDWIEKDKQFKEEKQKRGIEVE